MICEACNDSRTHLTNPTVDFVSLLVVGKNHCPMIVKTDFGSI